MAYMDNTGDVGWQAHRVIDDVPDMPVLDLPADDNYPYRIPMDKRIFRLRFEDETEDSVTIVVEKK